MAVRQLSSLLTLAHNISVFARLPRLLSSFLTVSDHPSHMIWFANLIMAKHRRGTLMMIGSCLLRV